MKINFEIATFSIFNFWDYIYIYIIYIYHYIYISLSIYHYIYIYIYLHLFFMRYHIMDVMFCASLTKPQDASPSRQTFLAIAKLLCTSISKVLSLSLWLLPRYNFLLLFILFFHSFWEGGMWPIWLLPYYHLFIWALSCCFYWFGQVVSFSATAGG